MGVGSWELRVIYLPHLPHPPHPPHPPHLPTELRITNYELVQSDLCQALARQGYFILKCDVFKAPLKDVGEGFRVRAKTTVLNLNRV